MRKTLGLLALGLLVLPVSVAQAEGDAKVYYKGGTRLEFPSAEDFKLKMKLRLQPRYSYESYDESAARGIDDRNSFEIKRARINLSGSALNGQAKFKLQNDFTDDDSGLKDAWLQWNLDKQAKVRLGRFKVPFSRQELTSSTKLQFVDRSLASEEFAEGRENGAMVHGSLGGGLKYALSATNGNSDGEGGDNSRGQDTNLLGAAQLTYSDGGYKRAHEGDYGNSSGTAWTAGVAAIYDEATSDSVAVDTFRLNGDFGVKCSGASLQGEFYYRQTDVDGASDEVDDIGYYVQAGYMVVPKEWEVAGRFAALNPDNDDDTYEFTVGLNRYYWGHDLKTQINVTILEEDPDSGSSTTDVITTVQVTAYI